MSAVRVAIRVDASRRIGWGHVKRCLALAQGLRRQGAEVRFLIRHSDANAAALIGAAGLELTTLYTQRPRLDIDPPAPVPHAAWLAVSPLQDADDTVAALQAWRPNVVVVDHYALDATWHRALHQATSAPVVAIDDLADRPLDVALLIDHNPSPDHQAKYRAVLAADARLCAGPAYALLDAVYTEREAPPWDDVVHSIGIFMGGTDPQDYSRWALAVCREQAGWAGPVQVATTSANPQLPSLQDACERDRALQVLVDQPHLAAFHAAHGLQIGAGGGALWERCVLGVPTVALITAANQRLSVPWLAEAGVVVGLDAVDRTPACAAELGAAIARLLARPQERAALRQRSMALVDGHGADRAARAVLNCL